MRHSNSLNRSAETGSTILMGLTIMAMGTAGLAAWVSLLSARAKHVSNAESLVSHRIAELNARSVVKQLLYSKALTEQRSSPRFIVMPGSSDRSIIPGTDSSPFSSTVTPEKIVRIGQSNGHGFQVSLPVSMKVGRRVTRSPDSAQNFTTYLREYLLRSRSPQLSGDLLVMHKPKVSVGASQRLGGNIRVHGNTLLWDPANIVVDDLVRTVNYLTPTLPDPTVSEHVRNLDGNLNPPSNFALMGRSSGGVGLTAGFEGKFNVIDPGPLAPWSMKRVILRSGNTQLSGNLPYNNGRGAVSDGDGRVDIDLGSYFLPNIIVKNHVREVHFHGQSDFSYNHAESLSSVAVMIQQSSESSLDLSRIYFHGKNNRRLIVAIKNSGSSPAQEIRYAFTKAETNPLWRLILIAENVPLKVLESSNPAGKVTIHGGVSTDDSFVWSEDKNKLLEIRREFDPKLLEYMAPRTAWIESYPN